MVVFVSVLCLYILHTALGSTVVLKIFDYILCTDKTQTHDQSLKLAYSCEIWLCEYFVVEDGLCDEHEGRQGSSRTFQANRCSTGN